jgi:hypothetical protein
MNFRLAMSIAISPASSAPWLLRCAIMMMCLLLLQRRRHQVQNHSHRTLDIDVRRQSLYQLHHRRRSLDTFLFSCVPHVGSCNLRRIRQRYLYPWLDRQVRRWITHMDQSKASPAILLRHGRDHRDYCCRCSPGSAFDLTGAMQPTMLAIDDEMIEIADFFSTSTAIQGGYPGIQSHALSHDAPASMRTRKLAYQKPRFCRKAR